MTDYDILGLTPEASPEDIKRAYRRLAMRWHPDRNPDPDATERFKEIRAAYDALLLPEAEAASSVPDESTASPAGTPRAADIRLNVEISLYEAFAGCAKRISYQRGHPCGLCDGTGEYGISRTRFCGACHGSGRVRDQAAGLKACELCAGRGFFVERSCPDCAGSGRDTEDMGLEVRIPPGMLSGDDLRLAGQGEPATESLAAGDLFLTVIIREDEYFSLKGRDLWLEMPVNALLLMIGGELEVPLPMGSQRIVIEAGDIVRRNVTLAGQGYPGRGQNAAGDLHLALMPVFPVDMTSRQVKLLKQLIDSLDENPDTHLPLIAAWRMRFKDGDVSES